jgi:hypothetical protein
MTDDPDAWLDVECPLCEVPPGRLCRDEIPRSKLMPALLERIGDAPVWAELTEPHRARVTGILSEARNPNRAPRVDPPMLDPDEIMKRADVLAEEHPIGRFGAPPSADLVTSLVLRALCEALNEMLAPIAASLEEAAAAARTGYVDEHPEAP